MNVRGPWSQEEALGFADEVVVPARVACNTPSGWPTSVSLWYLVDDDVFWCATQRSARIIEWLREDPRCSIEIAPENPPYKGLRARAQATLLPDSEGELLRRLIDRYLGSDQFPLARKLLARSADEVAIRLDPISLSSWDFSERMKGIGASPPAPASA
jgi:nitroimidazol reductase NimA-like FMN-containing flavoprotein (pyridoxamine 5'-phosphate oxidase superfamily)